MRNLILKTLSPLLSLCIIFAGCAKQPTADISTTEKPVQVALTQDMLSFDPIKTSDIFSEAVLRCVYTSLYDFDDDLNLRPKLVKKDRIIDPLTTEIEIHENVKFHDGSPLTAEDVVFSIERAMTGERTQKLLEDIKKVEQIDDTHFTLTTYEPRPNILAIFAKAETSILSKEVCQNSGYDFSVPVGSGPFKLISREENKIISLERFDDYYLEAAASKYLNFVVIITEQERTAAFLNGDIDILFSVSAYDCEKLKLSDNVKLLQSPSTKIEYLSLNNLKPPFDDPRVRKAISLAIDRDQITSAVYHGYSTPSASLIPNGIVGFLEPEVTYDPELAKELLAQAGYPDGFSFDVITINTIRKNTLEYIKLDLSKIGVQLNYDLVTMKEAGDMMNAGEHQSILVGWAFSFDPNSVLSVLIGSGSGKTMNSSNYSNPEVDLLMEQARAELQFGKQKQLYEQINTIVTQDSPIVVLQNPMVLSAARENIDGIHFNSQGLIQYETIFRIPS